MAADDDPKKAAFREQLEANEGRSEDELEANEGWSEVETPSRNSWISDRLFMAGGVLLVLTVVPIYVQSLVLRECIYYLTDFLEVLPLPGGVLGVVWVFAWGIGSGPARRSKASIRATSVGIVLCLLPIPLSLLMSFILEYHVNPSC